MTPSEIIAKTAGADADAILAALDAAGYVVVPKEPTEAMREAFYEAEDATNGGYVRAYRAMLAAHADEMEELSPGYKARREALKTKP